MAISRCLVIFLLFFTLVVQHQLGLPVRSSNTCGYDSCNLGKKGKLNVHIVSHTHDDVGWLKTVDQYYYGSRNEIRHRGVQYILDSVIPSLLENPDRRFIYVEMAFFWRWWNEQTDQMKSDVKQLVNEGRLEFISGGWSMHDEATTHYNSMIDQHTLGAEFLSNEFGDCGRTKIGWQIDPFGHSREVASLFAQMGFDGLFFGRADYQDIQHRFSTKTMEMIWKASDNLDRQSWLFTGILPHGYSAPTFFCFDIQCQDNPVMDDQRLEDYNVDQLVQTFMDTAHDEALGYATNHIIMTMGGDFQDQNANEKFKNLDKLIQYVNAQQSNGSDVNIFYSTPSCYLFALNQANQSWISKQDDFFPYASHPHGFWTGYFTSRAALKRYERYSNNILQVIRQLNGFSQMNQRNELFHLSEAMGVVQHHDAVSGTERQDVAEDYAQRLSDGIDQAMSLLNRVYDKIMVKPDQTSLHLNHFLCSLTNISECLPIEGQSQFTLTLWNPTIHPVTIYPRIPVTRQYSIRDPQGNLVSAQLLPILNPTKSIPGRSSSANNEYIFVTTLPALGYNTYYFEATRNENETFRSKSGQTMDKIDSTPMLDTNEACILENEYLRVEFDDQGYLRKITNLNESLVLPFVDQGFYWYSSFPGNNSRSQWQASGAYIFRPLNSEPQPVSNQRTITCMKNDLVQSALIVFNDWISEEIHLYAGASNVEIEWIVGPIPIEDRLGKEIILRYDTNMNNEGKYMTDANGREILQRIRNYRPTWNYTTVEPVSGNYYPVNSRIAIADDQRQLTILTDRSQGGGSLKDGSIELMIHRRILHDDSLGVGEPLNETAYNQGLVVRGKHYLLLQSPSASARLHRIQSQILFLSPLATFTLPNTSTYADYTRIYSLTWSALNNQSLPLNIHLLTFDQLTDKDYLIRLEHYFELNEDPIYSQPVTFDLQNLFQSFAQINQITELTLNANLNLQDLHRLQWLTNTGESSINFQKHLDQSLSSTEETIITLNPMQIRTFKITIN